MKIRILLISLITTVCLSCSVSPQKIEYGKDACHYCKMTIVDRTHASQTVTKKGKNFKYDAIECMINDLDSKEDKLFAHILVSDFSSPETLIDATQAYFIISPEIKSPMGANLSAFKDKIKADYFNGNQYTWASIRAHFKN